MYTTARYLAGLQHDPEFPVQIDMSLAIQLFQRCIQEQGHVDAMFDLAVIHERSFSHRVKDLPLAINLYSRCAVHGHVPAMYNLAQIFLENKYGSYAQRFYRDAQRAADLYQRCIDACGHYGAMQKLIAILMNGALGVQVDIPRAAELYHRCVNERNDEKAMISLAEIYASGRGHVERDESRTVQLCERFIDVSDNVQRIYHFAIDLNLDESNMQKDLKVRLLKLCIDKKDLTAAKIALAEAYLVGNPSSEDIEHVKDLYSEFIQSNQSANDAKKLASIVATGSPKIQRNIPLAKFMIELCVEKFNDSESLIHLAEILSCDDKDFQNFDRAKQLCETQIERGFTSNVAKLAQKLAAGENQISCNTPLAIYLCELCIARDDTIAMVCRVNIILSGEPREEDIDRAVELCDCVFTQLRDKHRRRDLLDIAKDLAFADSSKCKRVVSSAILYCEMCIAKSNDEYALATLARILIVAFPGQHSNQRVVRLCEKAAKAYGKSLHLRKLFWDIGMGQSNLKKNIPLAIELYEVFINNNNTENIIDLVEFLMTGPTSIRDFDRGIDLVRDYFSRQDANFLDYEHVKDVVVKKVQGSNGMVGDKQMAVKLFDAIMETDEKGSTIRSALAVLAYGDMEQSDVDRTVEICARRLDRVRSGFHIVIGVARRLNGGTERDAIKCKLAVILLELCIEKRNSIEAMEYLAEIFAEGAPGVEMDLSRAIELRERVRKALGGS